MTIKTLMTMLAVVAVLLIGVPRADAARPLNVDCDLLDATNDAVDDFLDAEGMSPDNLGDLIATAILDEATFEALRSLILFFSGGEIDFSSASEAVATNGKCGLIPRVIDNVRD